MREASESGKGWRVIADWPVGVGLFQYRKTVSSALAGFLRAGGFQFQEALPAVVSAVAQPHGNADIRPCRLGIIGVDGRKTPVGWPFLQSVAAPLASRLSGLAAGVPAVPSFLQILGRLVPRPSVARQAARTVVAALSAEIIVRYFDLSQGYWAVLTAIAVVQLTVGATIRRGSNRMLGTLIGAGAGMLALWLQVTLGLPPMVGMVGTLFLTALVGAAFPVLRLAPYNAGVVLLGANVAGDVLGSGINRVLDVVIGSMLGILVSIFVLPVYAGLRVQQRLAVILRQCSGLLAAQIDEFAGVGPDQATIAALAARIDASLAEADALAADAGREIDDVGDVTGVVRAVERLWYSIMAIDRGGQGVLPVQIHAPIWRPLHALTQALRVALIDTGNNLSQQRPAPPLDAVIAAQGALARTLQGLRAAGTMRGLDPDVAMRVYAVVLSLDEVVRDFRELAKRVDEVALPTDARA